jgi:hypothetical protein
VELQTVLGVDVKDQQAAGATLGALDAAFAFLLISIFLATGIVVGGVFAAAHCCSDVWIFRALHATLFAMSVLKLLTTFIGTMCGLSALTFFRDKAFEGMEAKAAPRAETKAEGGAALAIAVICMFIDIVPVILCALSVVCESDLPKPPIEKCVKAEQCAAGWPSLCWNRPAERLLDLPLVGLGPEVYYHGTAEDREIEKRSSTVRKNPLSFFTSRKSQAGGDAEVRREPPRKTKTAAKKKKKKKKGAPPKPGKEYRRSGV